MNLASLLYYFNNQHIFFQANLPNCVHFLTNFYVLPNFFSAWSLFFVFISACRKTRPVKCRTFLCRSCRKSSHRLLFSGWHGKQVRLFATRWWWISCSLSEHICRATALFIRFLPCRIRKRLRLLLLRRFLKKAKKIHAQTAWFLPELTAHCGPAPDRRRSDRPHP